MSAKAMIRRALRNQGTTAPAAVSAATVTIEREAGHLAPAYTPAEFNAFMIMLDRGTHAAEGLYAPTRTAAMRGMRIMAHRDPQRLGRLLHDHNQGWAVNELITYSESHATA